MKILRNILIVLFLLLLIAGWVRYYWVFGEGAKSGQLNYVVYKGILFKTYEGKLIQSGIRAQGASLNSYEFEFSVADKRIAEEMMARSGDQFTLHYKEYLGALPWRGHTRYVVDSIISAEKVEH
ncbi:MAG: hypothetical protein KJZ58_06575 [Flavobacteriales bacterium]|nr:hypothetical protein [Flavobacteriales bacterium]MCL4281911.1 hypothetical protein [Flavobacteriales bacterium]